MRSGSPPESDSELPAKTSDLWIFRTSAEAGVCIPQCVGAAHSLSEALRAVSRLRASCRVPGTKTSLQFNVCTPGGVDEMKTLQF